MIWTLARPFGVLTDSVTVPGRCGGLTAVIWSGVTVRAVGLKVSNATVVPPGRKSRPRITIDAPPMRGLVRGAALVIAGPENVRRPTVVPHKQALLAEGVYSVATQTSVGSVGSCAAAA